VAADGTVTDGLPPDRNPDKFGLTVFSVRDKASVRTDEEAGKSWDLESDGITGGFRRIPPHSRTALSYILKCFAVKQYDFSKLLKQLGNSFPLSG